MTRSEAATDVACNAMVDDLLRRRIIYSPAVEGAFRRVRRHAFLTPPYAVATHPLAAEVSETDDPCRVYTDVAVVIKAGRNLHCPRPSVVAQQIEQLAPGEGMRVLHVETGCGYATALLAEIVGERGTVVGTGYDETLLEMSAASLVRAGYTTVTLRSGDGAAGVPEAAPFDCILVSAGAADISPAWIQQLGDAGRLVLPLCHLGPLGPTISGGVMLTVEKSGAALNGRMSAVAVCGPLQGALAPTPAESVALAEGLQRWFALEEFYRTKLPIRIVMKTETERPPEPSAVPWHLETGNAVMWVEPN